MESTNYKTSQVDKANDNLMIRNFLNACLKHWLWFAISIAVIMSLAVYKVIRTEPVFERHADVLIEDQDMGAGADITSAFSKMGLVSSNTNVNNELISITSPAIMYEVVRRLTLTNSFVWKTYPHNFTLYGKSQPFTVDFPDLDSEQGVNFLIEYNPDHSGKISKLETYINGKKKKIEFEGELKAGQTQIKSPLGRINIVPNPRYTGRVVEPMKIQVSHSGILACTEYYSKLLKGDLVDQEADVIDLVIKDTNIERADDILNTVIAVYNENWVENKNRTAVATSSFIDERLKVIESELGIVDEDISKFKSAHRVPDLEMTAQSYTKMGTDVETELIKAHNELSMTNYVADYLKDPANRNSIIPMNTGVGNHVLEQQISDFNTLLLNRNNLAANSSASNPIVQQYDTDLRGMRDAIVRGVASQRVALTAAIRNYESAKGQNDNQLSTAPKQAKYLLSVERQQKIKEELYLYLLQKREENEINQAFTAYNTRIITPPTGPLAPVSPKKKLIILLAFVFAVGIPASIIYVIVNNDTKIRSKKDLESITAPFAGEIPNASKDKGVLSKVKTKKQKKKDIDKPLFVVEEGNRNVVNEAFRVVRSNINMMLGKDAKCPVILFTSFNPGSGKSFISYNLSVAFELKQKKVLLIDTDLRHGSSSNYVNKPRKGLSDYLLNNTDDWQSLVVKASAPSSPDVLAIGKMPPNPAELLENGRIGKLIEDARNYYDLIILDCPPVDIVVDTQIVEEYADSTIFVVRAGLLDKTALIELEEIYKSKRFKRMSVLLNGTDSTHSRYHSYGNYQNLEADRG